MNVRLIHQENNIASCRVDILKHHLGISTLKQVTPMHIVFLILQAPVRTFLDNIERTLNKYIYIGKMNRNKGRIKTNYFVGYYATHKYHESSVDCHGGFTEVFLVCFRLQE